jgi:NAD(P)H-flavin reductase
MPVVIDRVDQEGPSGVTTYSMRLRDHDLAVSYRFEPGQFNMLYLPGIGEVAISISSDPAEPQVLRHTVRRVGNVTQALGRLRPGNSLAIRGPFGRPWPLEQLTRCDVVLAAGGIGLAPVRPLIYHLIRQRQDFGRVTLLYGARRPSDLLYMREFPAWRDAGLEILVTVDLGDADWNGQIGVVPGLFDHLSLEPGRTRVVTCGPEIMMRFVALAGLERGIAAQHVYLSLERNMQCAVGLCGHCQLGAEFICKDGPVFTYQRMAPYMQREDL